MKSLFFSLILIVAGFLHASDWTTDYHAALEHAKAQNKLVLLNFTGSDWCGHCQLLDKQVFTQPEFHDYTDQNYILVTVDFPLQKQLPNDLKSQNEALGKQFKINGYPTLVVLDADGKELGRIVGYVSESGPNALLSNLKTFDTRKR